MTIAPVDVRYDRPLSVLESIHMLSSNTLWYTLEIEGPLDLDLLRTASELLRTEHPVLSARLLPHEERIVAELPGCTLSLPADLDTGYVRVKEHGAALVPYSAGLGEEVSFVEVIPRDNSHLVSFAVVHAVADGRLGYYWMQQLWSHYTDLAEGGAPELEPRPVPKPPELLLAERGVAKNKHVVKRSEQVAPSGLPSPAFAAPLRERVQLSAEDTERLRRYAKAKGQTMHGLVAGAVAAAMRHAMPAQEDAAVPIALISPVDLRERLGEPIPVWGGTNVLGDAHAVVLATSDSDPAALGAQVLEQLHEDLATGVVQQDFFNFLDFFTKEQPNIPHTITTNLGVLGPVRLPAGMSAPEFTCWVQTDWTTIIAMLQEWGQSGAHPLMGPLHLISTYRGSLALDVSLPLPAVQARAYAEDLHRLLVAMAAR